MAHSKLTLKLKTNGSIKDKTAEFETHHHYILPIWLWQVRRGFRQL